MIIETWYKQSEEEFEYCADCIDKIENHDEEDIINSIYDSDEYVYCEGCGQQLIRTKQHIINTMRKD